MRLLLLCFAFFVTSCATQHFNLVGEKTRTVPSYEGKHHFIFWGLGQEKMVNPSEACKKNQKIEAVDTHLTFLDGLLSGITWGIYYPRSYAVYCSKE